MQWRCMMLYMQSVDWKSGLEIDRLFLCWFQIAWAYLTEPSIAWIVFKIIFSNSFLHWWDLEFLYTAVYAENEDYSSLDLLFKYKIIKIKYWSYKSKCSLTVTFAYLRSSKLVYVHVTVRVLLSCRKTVAGVVILYYWVQSLK